MAHNAPNLLGWNRNDDAVAAYTATLMAEHGAATFSASSPALIGHWNRSVATGTCHVLAQTFEAQVLGQNLPAEAQREGTCVARGTFRAIQDAHFYDLAHGQIGRPVRLAFEPIYIGSRIEIGRGQLGRGAGSVGAWAAEWVARYGVNERRRYDSIDLTRDREDLAVAWAAPGGGVPADVELAARDHTVAAHRVMNTGELADCIAAGYFAAYCSGLLWGDRDAEGFARPEQQGNHCEEICGVFLRPNGKTAFVKQQSWGDLPRGPSRIRTQSGVIQLRQGSYAAFPEDLQRGLDQGGECWCFKLRRHFRPASLGDLLS